MKLVQKVNKGTAEGIITDFPDGLTEFKDLPENIQWSLVRAGGKYFLARSAVTSLARETGKSVTMTLAEAMASKRRVSKQMTEQAKKMLASISTEEGKKKLAKLCSTIEFPMPDELTFETCVKILQAKKAWLEE